ncbi:Alpha/beta hydrolase fold-1 [Plectosphaerella plurivora]|uniref:Alpha/beta hydrolase fold-1 n=1 Tax=Plectosphaerella plurivora TaxID=936078 RepID=A0A9P8V2C0_9PEZI|nr:Alpha/beta hydrolase fold-1 [Plectosphaerella plurivora]
MSTSPVILFTPGAWHGPWAFDTIRKELGGRGLDTGAVTLPSVGSTDPSFGVAEDTAAVRAEIEKLVNEGREIVVVAHSYGGVPSSNAVEGFNLKDRAAAGKKGGVASVIYMTSFAIPAGTSLMDGVGGVYPPWWNVSVPGFLSPMTPLEIFYADVPADIAAAAVSRILPEPLNIATDKSGFEPWNQGFSVGYIFAEDDQAIPLAAQQGMATQFPAGSFTASLKSSHSPFLSMPKALGDIIEKIAAGF